MSYNMVDFGPLTAKIRWRVWGTPAYFKGFRDLAALLHATLVVGVSQTAALNWGCHLYSTGRPPRWALAHILLVSVGLKCAVMQYIIKLKTGYSQFSLTQFRYCLLQFNDIWSDCAEIYWNRIEASLKGFFCVVILLSQCRLTKCVDAVHWFV